MSKSIILSDLLQIFKSSVSAVLPENLIKKSINYIPKTQQLTILSQKYNLQNKNVYIVGAGKAVQNMALEVEKILNSKINEGIISIPVGSLNNKSPNNSNVKYLEGGQNNLPDEEAVMSTRKIKGIVSKLTQNDILLVMLSGGGSALLTLPKEPITLEEKTILIKKLANSGADIRELNTVRKRLSNVKGGKLAMDAQPAQVVTLILSDIVGDPIDLIASGPTSENDDNPVESINIIKKYKLFNDIPQSIRTILEENDFKEEFPADNVQNLIIGSNKLSIEEAISEAKLLNYYPIALSNVVTGNVSDLVTEYVTLVKAFCDYRNGNLNISQLKGLIGSLNIPGIKLNFIDTNDEVRSFKDKDFCLILGGETTVQVKGSGLGGRNQQIALEFSKSIHKLIHELKGHNIYFLSAGTDGIDGPTDAAGAIGYLNLVSECNEANINVNTYIDNNDCYNFYRMFKNGKLHVITGHTNTNVMDIHLIIIKSL